MLRKCVLFVCATLASCNELAGLSDYTTGTLGDQARAGAGVSADVEPADAGANAQIEASPDGQLTQNGGAASDAARGPDVDGQVDASLDGQPAQDTGAGSDAGADAGEDAAPEAEPVLTYSPSSASLSILAADAGTCSSSNTQTASLHLLNARDAGVALLWVGYAPACAETSYGNVAPGGSQDVMTTYVTHVWRIEEQQSAQFITEFRIDSPASYTVTVH